MKIIALLNWYEESVSWLAAWTTAAAKVADHVVCVDGAYDLFPGALRRPTSGPEQAEAIIEAAHAAGIGATVVVPKKHWRGGEVEKRSFILAAGMLVAEPMVDWFLWVDGDESVASVPLDLRERLEATECHVGGVTLWQRNARHPLPTDGQDVAFLDGSPMCESVRDHRVLYRAVPGIRCEYAHYIIVCEVDGEKLYLRGREDLHELAPMINCTDLTIEHRHIFRLQDRNRKALTYCAARDACGLESVAMETA